MVIAVNCRLLLHNRLEGIGRYAHETLKLLVTRHPEHQFIFIFDRPWHDEFIYASNVIPVVAHPQARHPLLYYWWFNYSLPPIFKKYQVDIFLSPDGYISLRTAIPQITVIHDLAFEHYPEGIGRAERFYYKRFFPQFARVARKIVTVSEFSKKDIQQLYQIDDNKILVSCNAAVKGFTPLAPDIKESIRQKYTRGNAYFLFVGALHPRKNLVNLLLAFDAFKKQTGSSDKLLLVGRMAWKAGGMKDIYDGMEYKNEVLFTGRLDDDELALITAAALAMCYVSLFEGFGIPILEAMQSGVPVITTERSSMSEVAGGAAMLVDPLSPTQMAQAMRRLSTETDLRNSLIEKGLQRATYYSWDRAVDSLETAIFDSTF